jgi:hypothetical protein
MIAGQEEAGVPPSQTQLTQLTTVLTTTMTTVGLPDAPNYATVELTSCLVTLPARTYGSEGLGVRIPSGALRQRPFPSLWEAALLQFDDSSQRTRAMATSLGFEGHMKWAEAMP